MKPKNNQNRQKTESVRILGTLRGVKSLSMEF